MFIELTTFHGRKVLYNISTIKLVEPCSTGGCYIDTEYYKESYEEVKAMIMQWTQPKFIIGGVCED